MASPIKNTKPPINIITNNVPIILILYEQNNAIKPQIPINMNRDFCSSDETKYPITPMNKKSNASDVIFNPLIFLYVDINNMGMKTL